MFAPRYHETRRSKAASFAIFGQTWHFTRPAISALNLYGLGSRKSLKALIIHTGTYAGIAEGTHEISFQGVDLQLVVQGDQVLVVDPFFPTMTQ